MSSADGLHSALRTSGVRCWHVRPCVLCSCAAVWPAAAACWCRCWYRTTRRSAAAGSASLRNFQATHQPCHPWQWLRHGWLLLQYSTQGAMSGQVLTADPLHMTPCCVPAGPGCGAGPVVQRGHGGRQAGRDQLWQGAGAGGAHGRGAVHRAADAGGGAGHGQGGVGRRRGSREQRVAVLRLSGSACCMRACVLPAAVAWQRAGCCRCWVHGLTVAWVQQRGIPSGCTCGGIGQSWLAGQLRRHSGDVRDWCCMQRHVSRGICSLFMYPGATASWHCECVSWSRKSVVSLSAGAVQRYPFRNRGWCVVECRRRMHGWTLGLICSRQAHHSSGMHGPSEAPGMASLLSEAPTK